VAAVLDGSSFIGYLDGSAFDTNTGAGSLPSHSDDTGIGAVNGATKLDSGSNGAFAGLIDDVLLYNRSLSASDLSALVGQVLLVAAGADTSGTVNNAIALAGSSNGSSQTWTKVSGTGNVVFGNASAASTTATMDAGGSYVLRLTGSDGTTTIYDEVTVTVGANNPPVIAQGSSVFATMDEDASPTVWTAPTVTASDSDGDTLTWSLLSDGSKGSATVSGTGTSPITFLYAPSANANGSDSFVIQVSDGTATDSITVNVTITPRNDAPVITRVPVSAW
jgi:VCBS repeat-containing protein